MARVLSDSELREILDCLISIFRGEGGGLKYNFETCVKVLANSQVKAKIIWKILTYEDYTGELV